MPLHTAVAAAVRAAFKTFPSYRNDTMIAFSFETNKNQGNAEVASSSSELENSGFNLTRNSILCLK